VRNVARKYLIDKNSVTGYLLPSAGPTNHAGGRAADASVKGQF